MANTLLSWPNREPVLFAGLVAAAMLATAFGFQFAGYAPCEMCWWQRYPYFAAVTVALAARAFRALPALFTTALMALLFALDASLALFHVGVEQKWWEGFTSCTALVDFSGDMDATLDAIMNAPVVRCDEIAWSLFGISMAGYNFIIATAMTVFLVSHLRKA
jgi:disulfide bond formation protein DsbB